MKPEKNKLIKLDYNFKRYLYLKGIKVTLCHVLFAFQK